MIPFCVHSHYSIQNGYVDIDEYVATAAKMGFPAIALTDKNSLSGIVEFEQAVGKHNKNNKDRTIKGIYGLDLCVSIGEMVSYVTLLSKNKNGWHILVKLLSLAEYHPKAFSYICNIETILDLINSPHLIRISKQQFPRLPEIQYDFHPQDFNGHDIDYIKPEDRKIIQTLLGLKYKSNLDNIPHLKNQYPDVHAAYELNYYLEDFGPQSDILFDMCEAYSLAGPPQIPLYDPKEDPDKLLVKLAREGWLKRGLNKKVPKGSDLEKVYISRVKEELEIFTTYKLSNYLLIISGFTRFIRSKGFKCGLRGSAVGCLLSYLLDISDVDSIFPDPTLPYHKDRELVLSRFINKGRLAEGNNSLPDCDLDVPISLREDLIEEIKRKYGKECVANIITFQRMDGKQAIKEAFRIMGVPNHLIVSNEICSAMVDTGKVQDELEEMRADQPNYNIIQYCLDHIPKVQEYYSEYTNEFDLAIKLNKTIKNSGKHAAGIVICNKPISELFPVVKDPKTGENLLAVEMEFAEYIGAVKFDILGVAAYEKITAILEMIKSKRNEAFVYKHEEQNSETDGNSEFPS